MRAHVGSLCLAAALAGPALAAPEEKENAENAIAALQSRLSARLLEELKKAGPIGALAVCRDEAQALTAETARSHGVRVGRTSHRLRNPGNAAPAWAEKHVAAVAGKKAGDVEAVVVDLGNAVGLLKPIPTGGPCLSCHGRAEQLSEGVAAFLAGAYPEDRAVGFEVGDVRGFFWAEAPRPAAAPVRSPEADGGEQGQRLLAEAHPRCTVCHSIAGKLPSQE